MNHGHAHHGHGHDHAGPEVSDRRLLWAVVLNHLLTVAEVVAGILSGSAALLSDAAHNFNDANALLIAYVARRIARGSANERYTFGYRRAELIGATINLTLLAAVALFLVYEGVYRLLNPEPILGTLMAAAAAVALVVDVATALMLWAMSRGSVNVRAAFIHNLVDALGSLAVLIGAGAVIWLEWNWVDAALTLMIALYILWQVYQMLPGVVRVLMEAAPLGFDMHAMVRRVESVDGVDQIHHVHVWELDEQHRALEAHVVIDRSRVSDMETIKHDIKTILAEEFCIQHSTLEFEHADAMHDHHETGVIADRCVPRRSSR